jgi:alpha-tubulin suppressor-like RCC1 family protein
MSLMVVRKATFRTSPLRTNPLWGFVGLLVTVCVLALAGPAWAASPSTFAWGENEVGQLGNGTVANTEVRSPIGGLSDVSALAGGRRHSLALLSDGTVMAWGENAWGQLGDGADTGPDTCHAEFAQATGDEIPCATRPTPVEGISEAVTIAAGAQHSLALLKNGTVVAWGDNELGQLGDGTRSGPDHCYTEAEPTQCSTKPVPVSGLSEVTAIAAGENFSLALLKNGTVEAWGSNDLGDLGDGTSSAADDLPAPVLGLSGVKAIAARGGTGLALLSNGTVMAWGSNEFGELGDGTNAGPEFCAANSQLPCSGTPVPVSGLDHVSAIAMGASGLALLEDGTVMAWGDNDSGELGDGTHTGPEECFPINFCSTTPVAVSGLEHVTEIAGSDEHSLALLSDGTVMTWGMNWEGQLGNGTRESSDVPVAVLGLEDATAIAGGEEFSLAYGIQSQLPPFVANISPERGTPAGGTTVNITGSNFDEVTAVKFGSIDATSYTVNSEASITAVSPAGTGIVNVTVETKAGVSLSTTADHFTYGPTITRLEPGSGPAAGGTSVTITGSGFSGATAVSFGSNAAASFTVDSEDSITAVSPAGTGTVEVKVTTPDGSSPAGSADEFSYEAPPKTGQAPTIGGASVSDITEHSAKLWAQINPNGLETEYELLLTYMVCQSPTGYNCQVITSERVGRGTIAAGDEAQTVSADATKLSPGYSYDYSVIATNSGGESKGGSTFKTLPEGSAPTGQAPAIESVSVSGITEHDATLEAQIDTEGLETTYQFTMWSICGGKGVCQIVTNYRLPSGELLGSFASQRVSLDLSSAGVTLESGGTYFYSLTATNTAGTTEAHSQAFTTPEGFFEPLNTAAEPTTKGGESLSKAGDNGKSGSSSTATGSGESPVMPGVTPLVSPLVKTVEPKVLIKAQKLAKALMQCKKEPKRKQAACEKQAERKYAASKTKGTQARLRPRRLSE